MLLDPEKADSFFCNDFLLNNELIVQVCDATADAIKNFSPAHKIFV